MALPQDIDRQQAEAARLIRVALEEQRTPMWRDRKKVLAQEAFGNYRAYVEAGFTDSQALWLCQIKP